jgi:HEAT repeat protein
MKTKAFGLGFVVVAIAVNPPLSHALPADKGKQESSGVLVTDLDESRALGQAIKGKADAAVAKEVSGFSQKKGRFYKTALLSACQGNGMEMAGEVMKLGNQKLAAAILATDTMGHYLHNEKIERTLYKNLEKARNAITGGGGETDEGDTGVAIVAGKGVKKGAGRRRGAAGKAEKKAAAEVELIRTLLGDRDPETVRLAMMAAAYSGDASLKDPVQAVAAKSPAIEGARLLFLVRAECAPEEAEIAAAFNAALRDRITVTGVSGKMADFTLDLPGGVPACQALGHLRNPNHLPLLTAALNSPDLRVQVEAARAIGRLGSPEAIPVLNQKLATCSWPVLVEVASALGEIPDTRSIPGLINRLKIEKGRFRLDLVHALSSIAGEQKGGKAEDWDAWWRTAGSSFTVDDSRSKAFREKVRVQDVIIPALGYFYNLPIYSDRICFVIDTSNSMAGDRIASLRSNLRDTLLQMQKGKVSYNIVDFGGRVEIMTRTGLTSDPGKGVKRAAEMNLSVGTRSFDGLECGALLDEVDTLFFLSDGKPTVSEIDPWDEIRRALSLLHRQRPLAFFAVEFNMAGNTVPMVNMTDENSGLYQAIVITGMEEEEAKFMAGKQDKDDKVKKGLR